MITLLLPLAAFFIEPINETNTENIIINDIVITEHSDSPESVSQKINLKQNVVKENINAF